MFVGLRFFASKKSEPDLQIINAPFNSLKIALRNIRYLNGTGFGVLSTEGGKIGSLKEG
jgi:hypothetical protein